MTTQNTTDNEPGEALGAQIMEEVRRYNDGNGCTRRQLVDNILIAISQYESRAPLAAVGGDDALRQPWNGVWPLSDVLTRLADAVEHLLQDHDCDMHGYEGLSFAVPAARWFASKSGIAAASSSAPAEPPPNAFMEDRCMFRGGKTAHEPDCNHGHLTRFKVGDRLRNVHASYLPIATVTEFTPRGFRYGLERPLVISPRLGTQVGGESYDDSQWEEVAAPAEPVQPEGEQERLTGVMVGSSRHPHFTHADHERMKVTLDALSDNPTEEEAEAVLQACGTSGKEVVNEFIERLLRERSEMQAELDRLRAATPPTTPAAAMRAAEEVLRWLNLTEQAAVEPVAAIITRHLAADASTPTVSDAIAAVNRLYDEWWDNDRRRCLNVVLGRLRALSAKTTAAATTSPETPVPDDALTDAQVDAWLEAHKDDPVNLAQANRVEWLFRKKLAASIIEKAQEWLRYYDERVAQGGKGAQDMERLYGKEAAFHRDVIRAVETLALEPRSASPETPVGGEAQRTGTVEQLDGSVATFFPPLRCICDHSNHNRETGQCTTCGLFCGPVSNAVAREHLQAWSAAPVPAAGDDEGRYRSGVEDACKAICSCCADTVKWGEATRIEGSTRYWHTKHGPQYPCEATAIRVILAAALRSGGES